MRLKFVYSSCLQWSQVVLGNKSPHHWRRPRPDCSAGKAQARGAIHEFGAIPASFPGGLTLTLDHVQASQLWTGTHLLDTDSNTGKTLVKNVPIEKSIAQGLHSLVGIF